MDRINKKMPRRLELSQSIFASEWTLLAGMMNLEEAKAQYDRALELHELVKSGVRLSKLHGMHAG